MKQVINFQSALVSLHFKGNVQRNTIAQEACRYQVQELFLTEKYLPFAQR